MEDKASFYKSFFNEGIYVVNEPEMPVTEARPQLAGTIEEKPAKNIPISGNKMAKTLLLFNSPKGEDFSAEDKTFLKQILGAVKLSFDEVCWLNVNLYDVLWEEINYLSHAENIIAFGIDEKALPQKIEEGKILETENRKILYVDTLQEIASNINKKKLLWEGLKSIYKL